MGFVGPDETIDEWVEFKIVVDATELLNNSIDGLRKIVDWDKYESYRRYNSAN